MKAILIILFVSLSLYAQKKNESQNNTKDESDLMNPDGYIGGLTIKGGMFDFSPGRLVGQGDLSTEKTFNFKGELKFPISQLMTLSLFYQQLNIKYNGTDFSSWGGVNPFSITSVNNYYGIDVTVYMKKIF